MTTPLFISDLFESNNQHCQYIDIYEDFYEENEEVNDKFQRIITNLDVDNKSSKYLDTKRIESRWAVFFLVNAKKTNKKIHTVLGITDYSLDQLKNWFNNEKKNTYNQMKDCVGYWVVFLYFAGFKSWQDACGFFRLWREQSRGVKSRFIKARSIINRLLPDMKEVYYFSINVDRDEIIESIRKNIINRSKDLK